MFEWGGRKVKKLEGVEGRRQNILWDGKTFKGRVAKNYGE